MKSMRFIATNLLLLFAAGAFACGWWPQNSGGSVAIQNHAA